LLQTVKLHQKQCQGSPNQPPESNNVTPVDTGLSDLKTIENAAVNNRINYVNYFMRFYF